MVRQIVSAPKRHEPSQTTIDSFWRGWIQKFESLRAIADFLSSHSNDGNFRDFLSYTIPRSDSDDSDDSNSSVAFLDSGKINSKNGDSISNHSSEGVDMSFARRADFKRKTGYSPLEVKFPGQKQTTRARMYRDTIEEFQHDKLAGFTSRDLQQMDCLTTRELRSSTLDNPIIPLLQKENWEKTPHSDFPKRDMYQIRGHPGVWSAHNETVWSILKPILQLASELLQSADLLPWVCVRFILMAHC